MSIRTRFAVFCLAIAVSAASVTPGTATGAEQPPADAASATAATADSAGTVFQVQRTADLRYRNFEGKGEDPPADSPNVQVSAGLCDVYLPKAAGDTQSAETPPETEPQRRWPVILVIHGGGWATGDKWTMERHARQLAESGFAAVAINYRHAPVAKFPDQVDDVRAALVWIVDQAQRFGFDLDRVGLYGYSAGGHLALMVATVADESWQRVEPTTHWSREDGRWDKLPKIAAVCIGGPPTDFRDLPPDNTALSYFLGGSRRECPEVYEAASPICFASPGDPPIQIIQGEADGIVPAKNSRLYHQALVRSGVDASLQTLPGTGHLFAFLSPKLTEWMLGFFDQKLGSVRPTTSP